MSYLAYASYVKEKPMNMQPQHLTKVRAATRGDIPFLSQMDIEASSQPFGTPYWAELLDGTGTPPAAFVAAMLCEGASNWGNVDDFLILELDGVPAATCCVFLPSLTAVANGPLALGKLADIGWSLGWNAKQTERVRTKYLEAFANEAEFLKPQAEAIVETVAVAPEYRGKGLGTALMHAAFRRGRSLGATNIGIMVIHGNDTAQALYEKHFEPYTTFHAAYFDNDFPGLTKYRALLTN